MATIEDITPTVENVVALIDRLSPEEQKLLNEKLGLAPSTPKNEPQTEKTLADLFGCWCDDDRSAEEIIKDIYESRTMGRDIDL